MCAGRSSHPRLRRPGPLPAVRYTGILHEPHVIGGGPASSKHRSFQAVNTVLGNLKTALTGTYHAFGFEKYAHRYLAQVQYLFNRRFNLQTILTRLARAASRLPPRQDRARSMPFARLKQLADQESPNNES